MTFWAVDQVELISHSGSGQHETRVSIFLRSAGVEHIARTAPRGDVPPLGTLLLKGIDPKILMELPRHPTEIGFVCAKGALHIFPVEQWFVTGSNWAEFIVTALAQ